MDKPDYRIMVETITPLIPNDRPRLFFIKQHLITKNMFSMSHSLVGDTDSKKKKATAPVRKLTELSRADSSKVVYLEGDLQAIQYEVMIRIPQRGIHFKTLFVS